MHLQYPWLSCLNARQVGREEMSKSYKTSQCKGYMMGTSLANNNPKQGTKTSREESSLEDKYNSWDDVTSLRLDDSADTLRGIEDFKQNTAYTSTSSSP